MTFHIIIRGKNTYGKTRGEQEANLRKDGMGSMTEEQFDKCRWAEKKLKGSKIKLIKGHDIEKIK
jgi:hypothetical protein